jgi:hypothetical protein
MPSELLGALLARPARLRRNEIGTNVPFAPEGTKEGGDVKVETDTYSQHWYPPFCRLLDCIGH